MIARVVVAFALALFVLFGLSTPVSASPRGGRTVSGGSLRIEPGETVGDVTVMSGSVDVLGTIDGDLLVVGGSARVRPGASVTGGAHTVGGSLLLEEGSHVEGDVGVIGGVLRRATQSVESDAVSRGAHGRGSAGSSLRGIVRDITGALVRGGLIFALGVVFLALGGDRMESMRVEMATRPVRAFAVGLCSAIAVGVGVVALCITVVGIPFAIIGSVLLALVAAFGATAALTTVGEALLSHRTRNAYVHLALGSALFLVIGLVPVVGHMVQIGVFFTGIGLLFATLQGHKTSDRRAVAL